MLDKVTRYLSRQYVRRRLAEIVAPGYPILLDYPLKCSHRYGYGKPPHQQLFAMLEAGRNEYAKRLATKFTRRAIDDHSPQSRITWIDPAPRAEIDRICDSVIRRPLEELDLTYLMIWSRVIFCLSTACTELSQTPMSRSFLWMCCHGFEPELSCIFTIYFGIFWPYDYLLGWADQHYSEQYLLSAYLLGADISKAKIFLPNAFIVHDRELAAICAPRAEIAGIGRPYNAHGSPYGIGGGSLRLSSWPRVLSAT